MMVFSSFMIACYESFFLITRSFVHADLGYDVSREKFTYE